MDPTCSRPGTWLGLCAPASRLSSVSVFPAIQCYHRFPSLSFMYRSSSCRIDTTHRFTCVIIFIAADHHQSVKRGHVPRFDEGQTALSLLPCQGSYQRISSARPSRIPWSLLLELTYNDTISRMDESRFISSNLFCAIRESLSKSIG